MRFEEPVRLVFLSLIPLLILLYFYALRKKKVAAIRFGDFDTLKKAAAGPLPYKNYLSVALKSLVIASLIIALAGPHVETEIETSSSDVVLAIDVSGSMRATDFSPNRLEAAKSAARLFLRELKKGDRIGIVAFSGASYIISPISEDFNEVSNSITSIDIGAEDGTAIGDGIITSVSLLGGSTGRKKIVVLLSDGENNRGISPRDAAQFAKNSGVILYTIGIGSKEGSFIPGTLQIVGLDEELLQGIAQVTGGEYSKAASVEALRRIYSDIAKKITFEKGTQDISNYFLYAAALLLLTEFVLMSTKYRTLP
jgi:Ca-activated chloride channel family protein